MIRLESYKSYPSEEEMTAVAAIHSAASCIILAIAGKATWQVNTDHVHASLHATLPWEHKAWSLALSALTKIDNVSKSEFLYASIQVNTPGMYQQLLPCH